MKYLYNFYLLFFFHLGRLNVLANVCRKPLHQLFTQFAGLEAADDVNILIICNTLKY